MKKWKQTLPHCFVIGFAVLTLLNFVLTDAAEKSKEVDPRHGKRVFRFKTSDPQGMNIATETVFQPGAKEKIKVVIQSGTQTHSVVFLIKSLLDADPPHHFIEATFLEQNGRSNPETLHRPQLRTQEKIPVTLELGNFFLEILIEPLTK